MATYQYRCNDHGTSETTVALGHAPPTWPCPVCGRDGRRVYSPVTLARGGAYADAIERTERTRDRPALVTRLPETAHWRSQPVAPSTPALHRLPRP